MGAEANARKEVRVSHDRGTFGTLLGQLMAAGATAVTFHCDFTRQPEDKARWETQVRLGAVVLSGYGRTGEESLRHLVEQVRPPEAA